MSRTKRLCAGLAAIGIAGALCRAVAADVRACSLWDFSACGPSGAQWALLLAAGIVFSVGFVWLVLALLSLIAPPPDSATVLDEED